MDIAEAAKESEVQEFSEMQKYAYVSLHALENNFVGYCYRDYSDIKIDSGWRLIFGDESESYLENPDNSETKYISEILEWMPSLKDIIDSPRNTEFEWNEESKKYTRI